MNQPHLTPELNLLEDQLRRFLFRDIACRSGRPTANLERLSRSVDRSYRGRGEP